MRAGRLGALDATESFPDGPYVERKLDDYLDPANTVESLRARIPG